MGVWCFLPSQNLGPSHLEVVIVILWQGLGCSLGQLGLVARLGLFVDGELRGLESWGLDEVELVVSGELAGEPEERLLEVVIALGGDVVVLEVLLPVEGNLLGLHLAVLDLDLVAREDDGDVLADASEVTVPVRDVLVGDAGGDIKHDDGTLALNVVAVAEAAELWEGVVGEWVRNRMWERRCCTQGGLASIGWRASACSSPPSPHLLLTSSIPDIEFDGPSPGVEEQGVHLDS